MSLDQCYLLLMSISSMTAAARANPNRLSQNLSTLQNFMMPSSQQPAPQQTNQTSTPQPKKLLDISLPYSPSLSQFTPKFIPGKSNRCIFHFFFFFSFNFPHLNGLWRLESMTKIQNFIKDLDPKVLFSFHQFLSIKLLLLLLL